MAKKKSKRKVARKSSRRPAVGGGTAARKRSKKRASKRTASRTRSAAPPPALGGKFPERSGFALSDEQVETALVTGEHAGLLEDYLGTENYRELSELARQASSRSVRGGPRVFVLPGIMGSKLGIPRKGWFDDVLWLDPLDIARGELSKLAFKGDAGKIRPLGVLLFSYLKLKLSLKLDGFDADFHPYDWRQGLGGLGRELARRIVAEKRPVSLVAHSMGGLVSRAALTDRALDAQAVPRLVMLGTPNAGSFVPVQALRGIYGVVRKIAALDLSHDAEELATKVFSSFPGLYAMLPAPSAFGDLDLYDDANWPAQGPRPRAALLAAAKRAQDELAPPDERFRLIAGVNQETITGLAFDGTEFAYEHSLLGDGTVPLAFAELPSVPTWYVAESHGSLPNNGRVADAVRDLLRSGDTGELPKSWSPVRAVTRTIAESDPVPAPFDGRRGSELSQNEVRHLVEELAAPDARVAPTAVSAPSAAAATAFQGVVVGRRGQHRVDIQLSRDSITAADARAYVLGIFHDVAPAGAANAIDRHLGGAVREFTARRMFSGNVGEVFDMPAGRQTLYADHVLFVGLGRFDQLDDEVLELAAESAMRTLVLTKVEDFATVLFGTGSGWTAARSLNALLRGFLHALLDADGARRFRSITFCETDGKRYEELRNELYRLAGTALFDQVEVTISELPPSAPQFAPPEPALRGAAAAPRPVYLIVRDEGPGPAGRGAKGETMLRASLLEAHGKAAVLTEQQSVSTAALETHLAKIEKSGFTAASLVSFGERLAELVLHERIASGLHASAGHPLVLVHDAPASRIPWETLCIRGHFPASEGGLSRRYMAEDLSIAKWLEERRHDDVLRLLLVVNPTEDLDGAEEEGERVRALFAGSGSVRIDELGGERATREALLARFRSGDYDAVHYAGHAFFDPAHPQHAGLLCAGERVLSGADLARLGRLPSLVFFNACEAGRVRGRRATKTTTRALDVQGRLRRTTGLAESFLRGGVANYVGTYWPVGDAPAKAFAETFYTRLLTGAPIVAALQAGREVVRDQGSVDWADYIHYGSPEFQLKVKTEPAAPAPAPPKSTTAKSSKPKKKTKKTKKKKKKSKTARKKAARKRANRTRA